jgi:hypothetical protein
MLFNLKIQVEEDKRIEETLKEQLEEKDMCLHLIRRLVSKSRVLACPVGSCKAR